MHLAVDSMRFPGENAPPELAKQNSVGELSSIPKLRSLSHWRKIVITPTTYHPVLRRWAGLRLLVGVITCLKAIYLLRYFQERSVVLANDVVDAAFRRPNATLIGRSLVYFFEQVLSGQAGLMGSSSWSSTQVVMPTTMPIPV